MSTGFHARGLWSTGFEGFYLVQDFFSGSFWVPSLFRKFEGSRFRGFMEVKVSFQWGFVEYTVSFQWVYRVLGHISGGLWSTGSHFKGFMV